MNTHITLIRLKHRPALRWIVAGWVVAAVGAGYWWSRRTAPAPAASAAPAATTAQITVAPIESARITAIAIAYGSVVARPGKSNTLSLPFECVVHHVLVAPGESVATGQPSLEIGPSPATGLKIGQAKAALDAANEDLQQAKQRYNLKLATNQDLSQVRKAADTARLEWENLAGIEKQTQLASELPAIVGKVFVQDGQFVPAGQPLIELIPHHEIEVKLGVEAGDASQLKVGDTVKLFPVHGVAAQGVEGKIRLVTQRVSAETHLVDVYVAPAAGVSLWLEDYFRAELQTASNVGLVVPRAAVLPDGDSNVLFTVSNGHAVRHAVQLGLKTGQQVEVIANDLQAGQQIVVVGNHELTDGMAVTLASTP